MTLKKVIFYGDSNTYGYDPAGTYEMRYPKEKRWTAVVEEQFRSSLEIRTEGMNGRRLPDLRYDESYIHKILNLLGPDGLLCTMLGTNDILSSLEPDADVPIKRMDAYLRYLLTVLDPGQILIVAPPYVGDANTGDLLYRRFHEESIRMNEAFTEMAAERKGWFADASKWGIDLSFDRAHFSEEGHRVFAAKMIQLLLDVFPPHAFGVYCL